MTTRGNGPLKRPARWGKAFEGMHSKPLTAHEASIALAICEPGRQCGMGDSDPSVCTPVVFDQDKNTHPSPGSDAQAALRTMHPEALAQAQPAKG